MLLSKQFKQSVKALSQLLHTVSVTDKSHCLPGAKLMTTKLKKKKDNDGNNHDITMSVHADVSKYRK